ncbi:MAG: HAD-IB family phosphatase [Alistipes sp.]|nr:HAD-IB family phosphatase [Alistipes sp.]
MRKSPTFVAGYYGEAVVKHLKTRPTEALLAEHLADVRASGGVVAVGEVCRPARVIVFDLDATLIPCEFMDELAERRGLAHLTRELTARAMAGEIDFRESYLRRLEILRGTPVLLMEQLIGELPLAPRAVETVAALRAAGCRTAIVTGGCARLGRAVQRRLGVDALYATELEEVGGVITGRLAGELLDEGGKVAALVDFCGRFFGGVQGIGFGLRERGVVAVGDGANDLKMLAAADLAILYTSMPALGRVVQALDVVLGFCL